MIGKLERVRLRDVWPHEEDLTAWLKDNCDVISKVLGLNLSDVRKEQSAGAFKVDLLAEDASGDPVIIENQLEASDHDHLGKLVTYLVALEAKTAIWIVAEPRLEHVRAITWLNESSSAAFYLLKAEGVRIGNSPPALLLTPIVGPSQRIQEMGICERFWAQFLERARPRTSLHARTSPKGNWITTSSGRAGLYFAYVINQHGGRVELDIDLGKDRGEENKAIFDQLMEHKGQIENSFGGPLTWERLEQQRVSRVAYKLSEGGYRDGEEEWPRIQEAMIDAMIRFECALRPHIERLQV